LRAYRYEYDEDKKDYGRKPLHDWASHGADAYRGVAVVARVVEGLLKPEPKPPKAPPARPASSLSLDELWECR
jgi:phage terminase large subunit